MTQVSGYTICARIYASERTLVYRARSDVGNDTVVLKMPAPREPSHDQIARYVHEYRVLQHVASDSVARGRALVRSGASATLVLEDLADFAPLHEQRPRDLDETLRVFVRVAEALDDLHAHDVVHKDINPNNILISLAGDVRIIDFDIASCLATEQRTAGAFEGTLPYMSPEQTGRINRSVDYRSDYYSLGATFYELLTGKPPFASADPMEVIHGHIARRPVPPHEQRPSVPRAVSAIVMKLLEKSADDRYQSIDGLAFDLRECIARHARGESGDLVAAAGDVSGRFRISERLYGREAEVERLLEAFGAAAAGRTQLLLVCGNSGIGKTALVREAEKSVASRGGQFVSGKFDQLKRDVPYSAILQALRELLQHVLAEPPDRLAAWRDRLFRALGPNGAIVSAVVPELEWILGAQPAVPELPPLESQNRFCQTFRDFLRVFAHAEHPLLLFLDDLQWADTGTLGLLKVLLTDPVPQHLLVVGGYRENEVDSAHPLSITEAELRKDGVTAKRIVLAGLAPEHVERMIADALRAPEARVASLAQVVHKKTSGTPFFVRQFLTSLHREKLIEFDRAERAWRWDAARIEEQLATANVIDLLVTRVRNLPGGTADVLRLGSCVGASFDLGTLAAIGGRPPAQVAIELWIAVTEGLVVPIGSSYRLFLDSSEDAEDDPKLAATVRYRFQHDRIREAVYELIPDDEKKKTHLAIGQRMRALGSDQLFDVLSHLHAAGDLVAGAVDRPSLVAMNLEAGRRAKASTAYAPALTFLRAARTLLGDDGWSTDPVTTYTVHRELAECEYLSGDFARSTELCRAILEHVKSPVDRAEIAQIRVTQLAYENRMREALDVGLDALAELGIVLPRAPTRDDAVEMLERTERELAARRAEDLENAPEALDTPGLARVRLLMAVLAPAYQLDLQMYAVVGFTAVREIILHGVTSRSAFAYLTYGMLLGNVRGEYARGRQIADVGLKLLERFPTNELEGRCHFVFGYFVAHWRSEARRGIAALRQGTMRCLETGNFVYAAYCVAAEHFYELLTGMSLSELLERRQRGEAFFARVKNVGMHFVFACIMGACEALSDPARPSTAIVDPRFGTDEKPTGITTRVVRAFFEYLKLLVAYVLGSYDEAMVHAANLGAIPEAIAPAMHQATFAGLHALVLAARAPSLAPDARRDALEVIAREEERLRTWAASSPDNFRALYLLVRAERLHLLGRARAAEHAYERAVAEARRARLEPYVAIGCERAARHWASRANATVTRAYFAEARDAYLAWGAIRKVRQLEAERPELAPRPTATLAHLEPTTVRERRAASSTSSRSENVDLATVVKASHALASEVVVARLLEQMMRFALLNAGAAWGVLLLDEHHELRARASGRIRGEAVVVREASAGDPLDAPVSTAVVQYVARSRETLVLADASADSRFRADPYVAAGQVRSVLCVPLMKQGKLVAVLYLENALVAGAFVERHVEILRMLGAHLAICLENAALVRDLESRVADRTREVEEANRRLRELFDHMRQAIVVFGSDGRLLGEASQQARAVFSRDALEGISVRELVFGSLPEFDTNVVLFDEWLAALFEVDAAHVDEVLAMAPTEVLLHADTPEERYVVLEFQPIVHEGRVTRVMLLASDETEKRRLVRDAEAREEKHARELEAARRMALGGAHAFVAFLDACKERVERLSEWIGFAPRDLTVAEIDRAFQIVHTLKGEARAFALADLEAECATLEQRIARMRGAVPPSGTVSTAAMFDGLRECVVRIGASVGRAEAALVEASPSGAAVLDEITVRGDDVRELARLVSGRDGEIARVVARLAARPFGELAATLAEGAPRWAAAIGKQARVVVDGRSVRVPPSLEAPLRGAMTHLVRNAIAHGIEGPDARAAAAKEATGKITLTCVQEPGGRVRVTVADDGRGMDVAALRARAVATRVPVDARDGLELAFVPGLSTSASADELSGRGVGLAAVRAELAEIGYVVGVTTDMGAGTTFVLQRSESGAGEGGGA